MIFRTITDESTGAINSVGLFGKSLSELKTRISFIKTNGIINTFLNTSTIDVKAVLEYNDAIEQAIANGATLAEKQQIMKSAMEGTNKATAQLIGTTKGATVETEALTAAQEQSTLKAKAQSIALKAVSIAGNMFAMWLISKGIKIAATAIDNYIHRVELAREKLEETTSEIEALDSELQNVGSQIDDLLAKDTLTITEENDLKRLQAQNKELKNRQKILEAQKAIDAESLNQKIEDKYNKTFINNGSIVTVDQSGNQMTTENGEAYIKSRIDMAKSFLSLNRELTDEEKKNLEDIRLYLLQAGQTISESTEGYTAITEEQKARKANWEQMIADIAYIAETEPATIPEISNRLKERFSSTDTPSDDDISQWIDSLDDNDKRILIKCDLDEASLEDLKTYLSEQKGEIAGIAINETNLLGLSQTIDQLSTHLKPAMDSIKSAYQNIFTDDGFTLDNVDLLSISSSIKSQLDSLAESDLTVDYTAYESFIRVLENTESTEEDVSHAFNDLAQSIINAGVSGIEDFETLINVLEHSGVVNAEVTAFQSLIQNKDALKASGLDLANATYEQIASFASEIVSAENLTQAIQMLTCQKLMNAMANMDTSTEVANLRAFAESIGITGEMLNHLTELEMIYQEVANGTLSEHMLSKKLARVDELKALIEGNMADIKYTPAITYEPTFNNSSKQAETDYTSLLDKELALLEAQLDAGLISFQNYTDRRIAIIESYYRQGKLSADDYYSYLENHYETQLSYMDKVVNAVTRRIDREIDALEKQRSAIEDSYQEQIDFLEEQKTLLQEANQERERQLNLQKSLYELERARNQRTTLLYSEGRGMHYATDSDAIREAQQEVKDAELEIETAKIESAISELEKARDRETAAIDEMISKLQEYKEQWNDITSAYEEEQENLIAAQILGQEWENDILNTRLDTLEKFKDNYIAIQQAMVDAAYQAAQAMANAENVTIGDSSKGKITSLTEEPASGYEVIDESTAARKKAFTDKADANAYAEKLNRQKAASYHMTLAEFSNSNIPGYYVKKFHTGLRQGLVDQNSFHKDFRLVQKVGLGQTDVPAILQEGEAVATPGQIRNLAEGLRSVSLPDYLIPLSEDHPMMQMRRKLESAQMATIFCPVGNTALSAISDSFSKAVSDNNHMPQQVTIGDINITCPGVTSQEVMKQVGIALNREFSGMALTALQESRKR